MPSTHLLPLALILIALLPLVAGPKLGELFNQDLEFGDSALTEAALEEVKMDSISRVEVVDRERADKMRAEHQRLAPLIRERAFSVEQFERDVWARRPCSGEPIQAAVYNLLDVGNLRSHRWGVFHAGVLVCGIGRGLGLGPISSKPRNYTEIHFHRPGVEYWKPMEYSTRFEGGTFLKYKEILYKGEPIHTHKSFAEIVPIVERMKTEFRFNGQTFQFNKGSYRMLTNNCLNFARILVRQIAGLLPPEQVGWPPQLRHPFEKLLGLPAKKLRGSFGDSAKTLRKLSADSFSKVGQTARALSFRKSKSLPEMKEKDANKQRKLTHAKTTV